MKHFWIEFDNPFKKLGIDIIGVDTYNPIEFNMTVLSGRVETGRAYTEIILTILNITLHYLCRKGKL